MAHFFYELTVTGRSCTKSKNLGRDEECYAAVQLTGIGIVEAFRLTNDGYSADRVVADPELNSRFLEACNLALSVTQMEFSNALEPFE